MKELGPGCTPEFTMAIAYASYRFYLTNFKKAFINKVSKIFIRNGGLKTDQQACGTRV